MEIIRALLIDCRDYGVVPDYLREVLVTDMFFYSSCIKFPHCAANRYFNYHATQDEGSGKGLSYAASPFYESLALALCQSTFLGNITTALCR